MRLASESLLESYPSPNKVTGKALVPGLSCWTSLQSREGSDNRSEAVMLSFPSAP